MARIGIWHENDPDFAVDIRAALEAWAEAAVPVLEEVATEPYGFVTVEDFAGRVQERTGFHTELDLVTWTNQVLEIVRRDTLPALPPLTSLVVEAGTGEVGAQYRNADHAPGSMDGKSLMEVASQDRLRCYQAAGVLPEGARPKVTPLFKLATFTAAIDGAPVKAARGRRARAAKPVAAVAPTPAVCPKCFMQLPVSGVCDNCG